MFFDLDKLPAPLRALARKAEVEAQAEADKKARPVQLAAALKALRAEHVTRSNENATRLEEADREIAAAEEALRAARGGRADAWHAMLSWGLEFECRERALLKDMELDDPAVLAFARTLEAELKATRDLKIDVGAYDRYLSEPDETGHQIAELRVLSAAPSRSRRIAALEVALSQARSAATWASLDEEQRTAQIVAIRAQIPAVSDRDIVHVERVRIDARRDTVVWNVLESRLLHPGMTVDPLGTAAELSTNGG